MAKLQRYFDQFHKAIKLDDENEVLRDKREIILNALREGLNKLFEDRKENPPIFTSFNQGSYAMGTGVAPTDGDYDIDVGLDFDISIEDYPDPVVIKQWVADALEGHTNSVPMKNPCVTVQYQSNDEPEYHVDLAIYGHSFSSDTDLYLARGKSRSLPENRIWEPSDPKGFIKAIRERFDSDDRRQFRRVVRYLKRWKDVHFSSEGNAAPVGIGLTVVAYNWFSPQNILVDRLSNKYEYNDLAALLALVNQVLLYFQSVYHDDEQAERLSIQLPVQPFDDPFLRMTNRHMKTFKEKLERLKIALEEANHLAEVDMDVVAACEMLEKQFGQDFPIPEIKETAQPKRRAIAWSGDSA